MLNDNLEALAKSYFNSVFNDVAGVSDTKKISDLELPDDWYFAKVGDFCDYNIANLSKADQFSTILYLDTGNITQNYIAELQELDVDKDEIPSRAKRKVFDGDIVYSTVRPNLCHYGLIQNPPDNLIASTGFTVLHNKGTEVLNEFLYMWLTRTPVLEYLQAIAENSVSTYPSLNVEDLLNVKIVVPDGATLSRLNHVLQGNYNVIAQNNRQISLLERSKSFLLSKFFSGH